MPEHSEPELPPLPYDYDALEPHISEQVLTWHHDTHHQGYVNGLESAEETLAENRESGEFGSSAGAMGNVTHNGCGHYLHTLFWENMDPNGGGEPEGELADRIAEDFGSYEGWKGEFEAAASAAGGWALTPFWPSTSGSTRTTTTTDRHGVTSSTPSSRSSTGTRSRTSTTPQSVTSSNSRTRTFFAPRRERCRHRIDRSVAADTGTATPHPFNSGRCLPPAPSG